MVFGSAHQIPADESLIGRSRAASLTNINQARPTRKRQRVGVNQGVVEHHLSLLKKSRCVQREQIGRAGPYAHQIHSPVDWDACCRRRGRGGAALA